MGGVSVEDLLRDRGVAVDPSLRVLRVNDRTAELDSRSLSVFLALAEQFGLRVSKDVLLAAAWPNQVVHENSLAKAISRLRRALAGSELEIVASYGVGYLLRDSAEKRPKEPLPEPADASEAHVPVRRWKTPWAVAAAIAFVASAAGAVYAIRQTEVPVAFRTTAPITNDAWDTLATILWVDDHPSNNRLEIAYLKQQKIAVHLAQSTDDALNLLKFNDYKLIISDLGRGDDRLAGLTMTKALKQRGIKVPVIIYTIRPQGAVRQQAQRRLVAEAGAADLAVTPAEVRVKALARVLGSVPTS